MFPVKMSQPDEKGIAHFAFGTGYITYIIIWAFASLLIGMLNKMVNGFIIASCLITVGIDTFDY